MKFEKSEKKKKLTEEFPNVKFDVLVEGDKRTVTVIDADKLTQTTQNKIKLYLEQEGYVTTV